jgi:hypothetical protein
MDPITSFIVALVINIVAYMIMPKPKQAKPPAVQDAEDPVAEAGKPVPVVFGTMTVKGVNVLWFGDKSIRNYQINA